MTESPTIVKTSTAVDLLAMLPHLASGPLSPGIAIAPFAGNRTPSVLRHPLPRAGTTVELQGIAGSVLGLISRLRGCDSVLIAIYADDEFDAARGKYAELEQVLLARFRSAGFGVVDTILVARDGWACFDDGQRRALSEIAESPVGAYWAQQSGQRRVLDGMLPTTDALLAAKVQLALADHAIGIRVDSFGHVQTAAAADPVVSFEEALDLGAENLGPERLATLALDVQREGDFDRVVTQVFLGPRRADAVWSGILALRERSARRGEQPIELMLRERRRRAPGNEEVADLLSGLKGPRPDVARVETAIAVLGRTAAHVPLERRPTLLCVLAWLHWSIGLGTCAGRLLETSSTIDPHHELTAIINAITLTVMLPAWVLDRDLKEATTTVNEQGQVPSGAAGRRRTRR